MVQAKRRGKIKVQIRLKFENHGSKHLGLLAAEPSEDWLLCARAVVSLVSRFDGQQLQHQRLAEDRLQELRWSQGPRQLPGYRARCLLQP